MSAFSVLLAKKEKDREERDRRKSKHRRDKERGHEKEKDHIKKEEDNIENVDATGDYFCNDSVMKSQSLYYFFVYSVFCIPI